MLQVTATFARAGEESIVASGDGGSKKSAELNAAAALLRELANTMPA